MIELKNGDCFEVLKSLPDNSVDSIVTDPPAGINFMNLDFDSDKGGRDHWIAWLTSIMEEAKRVLKPGGHALVWALPRTSHWSASALEDAGFEIRDIIAHVFGSGFPKSLDISKAIDRMAGAEREVIAEVPHTTGIHRNHSIQRNEWEGGDSKQGKLKDELMKVTVPSTTAAKKWEGWGTALKPAHEHWILARKPISENTVAENVLKHGTGGLNIDVSRIAPSKDYGRSARNAEGTIRAHASFGGNRTDSGTGWATEAFKMKERDGEYASPLGRYPANFTLSHLDECVEIGIKKVKSQNGGGMNRDGANNNTYAKNQGHEKVQTVGYASEDGTETVEAWNCAEGCPVKELDKQSGVSKSSGGRVGNITGGIAVPKAAAFKGDPGFGDIGGASRFFYVAKPSKRERNLGCDGLPKKKNDFQRESSGLSSTTIDGVRQKGNCGQPNENHHPTVKPIRLMTYLIKMVTPPNGTVMDPFMGSGTTGIAAVQNGFGFVGIEREPEYFEIAKARIMNATEIQPEVPKDELPELF